VLCAELALTSHAGRYKLALIAPADAMNVNAANSLLKTLEEPTPNTLLMLLSASPGRLPATVRSRCHREHIHTPDRDSALNWLETHCGIDRVMAGRCLQIAGGAPFIAAELAESGGLELHDRRLSELVAIFQGQLDPLRAAVDWSDEHLAITLRWWQMWLQALIRWRQAGQGPGEPRVAQLLQPIAEKVDCKRVFGLCDRVALASNNLGSGLNRQLLAEDLLIDWASLAGRPLRPFAATGR
jgi:DNA polymerase-3 subunit delta'